MEEFLLASQFEIARAGRLHAPRTKLASAWSRLTTRLGDMMFEHGIETAGHVREVSHFHPDRVWYQASGWTYLRRVLPPREVGAGDVFLDMGSGKGRVLLQAAQRYPFARVIGS